MYFDLITVIHQSRMPCPTHYMDTWTVCTSECTLICGAPSSVCMVKGNSPQQPLCRYVRQRYII